MKALLKTEQVQNTFHLYFKTCIRTSVAVEILRSSETNFALLLDLYMGAIDARIYYWPINDREGYTQKGEYKNKEKTLSWAIIYRHYAKNKRKIIMNLGDLLVHVPCTERLKWKK